MRLSWGAWKTLFYGANKTVKFHQWMPYRSKSDLKDKAFLMRSIAVCTFLCIILYNFLGIFMVFTFFHFHIVLRGNLSFRDCFTFVRNDIWNRSRLKVAWYKSLRSEGGDHERLNHEIVRQNFIGRREKRWNIWGLLWCYGAPRVREGEGLVANAMIADHCVPSCGGWGEIDIHTI